MRLLAILGLVMTLTTACDRNTPTPSPEHTAAPAGSAQPAASAKAETATALDPAVIERATGAKPEVGDGVVKVSFPRTDVKVDVDGWQMPPFMGLTSWAGFTPGEKPGVEAMVMGDLVLFEDEVNEVMSALLNAGISVTALHNHFFFDKPNVFFMHIEGEGKTEALAKAVKGAIDTERAVRAKSAQPKDRSGASVIPAKSAIDAGKIETAFGTKSTSKDGMVKVVIGRPATQAACGCKIGKAMGVNTWAAFAGTDDNAVVDGDFAVAEDELQAVLKALREGGINIVAIHHHMTGEQPRILFLHYWGRGPAQSLATSVKKAVDLTKTAG